MVTMRAFFQKEREQAEAQRGSPPLTSHAAPAYQVGIPNSLVGKSTIVPSISPLVYGYRTDNKKL